MTKVVKSGLQLITEINEPLPMNSIAFWWLGQAGFAIKSNSVTIYIDPYLSDYCERVMKGTALAHERITASPLNPEDVNNADFVFCSHDHIDHLDPWGIPAISTASQKAKFVVPKAAINTLTNMGISMERIVPLVVEDETNLGNINVTALRSKHDEFDYDIKLGYPYLSFIIQINSFTIYHAGDTIPFSGQQEALSRYKVDLAFLPINGRDVIRQRLGLKGNFTFKEAADLAAYMKPRLTIPMHYDKFKINTDKVEYFTDYMSDNYPDLSLRIVNIGERVIINHEIN